MPYPVRRTAAVLAGVLALTAVGVAPAAAAPPSPGPVPAHHSNDLGSGARVTLITGDVVELAPAGGGRYAATVRPAAGRERITFHTLEVDGGLRVLPSDAVPLLASGKLDADLFDVEELIADGYGDSNSTSLPLIVKYQPQGDAARAAPPMLAGNSRPLASIGGAALAADKSTLAGFWRAQAAQVQQAAAAPHAAQARTLGGGIDRIWLDGRVHPALDRSTAQIGAPAAWQAGIDGHGVKVAVLDTGVDATHPDLAGRIKDAQNFTSSADTVDRFGHGTHVADTVGGTGAASNGSRKGVAPGADLLIGKVLGDDGSGYESWIIAGMEWAAAEGATVVSMSLGGEATDGTDPMSEAVDRISADSGALFVIAAGNEGADSTVGTPGAARSALTVGAVDRDDTLADFSSRGPRVGDQGLKPEITAPGVGIVAARAAGTSMGQPVDEYYTAASGTSMATPHVAGAAALLAQAHPDWKGPRLKDALVSTAHTTPDVSVFAQGAGRVDVARAVKQRVYGTGVVDFGARTAAGGAPPAKTITYTNESPGPVTLTLTVNATNLTTRKPETDAVALGTGSVTVPAGGTLDVPVTLDLAKLDPGQLSGWITATGPDGLLVTTALGATLDGPHHRVSVHALDRAGKPTFVPVFMLHGDDSRSDVMSWLPDGGAVFDVEEGAYLLQSVIEDGGPLDEQATLFTDPELQVTKDVDVVLDARKATPIRIETPKPAEQQAVLSYYVHRVTGSGRTISHGVMHFSNIRQVNVTPTRQVTAGSYEFSSRWQLVAPMVQASVDGVHGPLDINLLGNSPAYSGKRRFPLVRAGSGDVRGKAVLIPASPDRGEAEQIADAVAAGAAVALLVRPADWSAWTVWNPDGDRLPIPALAVANDDGQKLLDRVRKGRAAIDLTLTTSSPYLYDVLHVETGRIPERIVHRVTEANSVRITSRYAHNGGFDWVREQRFGWRPWQTYAWNDTSRIVATPSEREEWVSASDSMWQHRVNHAFPWNSFGPLQYGMVDAPRSYRPGRTAETWFGPVVRPAAPKGVPSLVSTRAGDILHLRVPEFVDSAGGHYTIGEADRVNAQVWRDGTLLADLPDARQDVATTPGDAAYRVALTTARGGDDWQWGTRTETLWQFRSGNRPGTAPLPLLQVDYGVPADLSGRVPGKPHLVGFTLRHQDGLAAPRGTTLKVEVSFDEGGHWRPVWSAGRDTAYTALIPAGKGTVSLKVHATDRSGNTVTQTVIRAYGMAGGSAS